MDADRQTHVTVLLDRLKEGDVEASDQLLDLVYHELRGLASAIFRSYRADHTLQPTALVHEAWLKMAGKMGRLESRRHFMAVAARAMRQVLTDHARSVQAQKRGGGVQTVVFDEQIHGDPQPETQDQWDLGALDQALAKLAEMDEPLANLVVLRLLGSMTMQEIADHLGMSKRTTEERWTFARIWLSRELAPGS